MMSVFRRGVLWLVVAAALGERLPAAEDAGDELTQMIVGLLKDTDPDMRTVGLQQVREEAKGAGATKRFAAVLPGLAPDAQVGLIDALGDRGDKAARSALLEMLKSPDERVRVAVLRSLASLGETADVPLLVQSLALAGPEKAGARGALTRMQSAGVEASIVAEVKCAKPAIRAELLGVLAARGMVEGVPMFLEAAEDADARVRLAAMAALRARADESHVPALVRLMKAAKSDQERERAESAVLAVCTRGREACVEAILAGMVDASPAVRVGLLRGLAKSGGAKALETIAAAMKDERAPVRVEAVRLLANWPDASAVAPLLEIAKQAETLGQHAVAIQGLVRLGSPLRDRPANMELLAGAMKLAKRAEEKRMVLGVLGGVATAESLSLVTAAVDDPALSEEACLAAVLIAEKSPDLDRGRLRAALEKCRDKAKEPELRQRAEQAMGALGTP